MYYDNHMRRLLCRERVEELARDARRVPQEVDERYPPPARQRRVARVRGSLRRALSQRAAA
jgi:hypothetical protein